MATVQWRPEVNALTTPQSWRPRCVPRNVINEDDLAAEIAQMLPNYSEDAARSIIDALIERIKVNLINGNQITLKNFLTCRISLSGRLNSPDAPLPSVEESLSVQITASRPFVDEICQKVELERLPMSKKLPLITKAEDTVLKLQDVLNPNGALHLRGSDLVFDQEDEGCGCVLEGTRSGSKVQSRYTVVSNSEITCLPDIPAQNDPWNNEYLLSVSTQYTEHGTVRTGIYERRLRAPLTVTKLGHPNPPDVGILTGNAAAAYVTVTGGALSADETLRIQVILEHDGGLSFSLLDMSEGGRTGAAVKVTANGAITLTGFSGSALSSLNLTVNNYADLVKMIRSGYSGRLADVLVMKTA
jgi:hypothetical protein